MALDRRIALLMWLAARTGRAFSPSLGTAAMREGYARMNAQFGMTDRSGVDARELSIPVEGGAIAARLYVPHGASAGPLPVLLYFHGGGFVIGDVASYDGLARFFAREGMLAVLSVEYRLGPEHRLPVAFEDAFAALAWLQREAAGLGLDAARIAAGGDSAGGTLAAALANYASAHGLARPAFAYLIYPAVDGTGGYPSRAKFEGANLPLTPATVRWFFERAASEPEFAHDALLNPLRAPDPQHHPPTYVSAARYDPLVDEGKAYADRLRDAGVPVTYDLRATLPHAFVNLAGAVPEARRALRAGIRATAAALGMRPVVALTGAASGIGRALALDLARRGYALALADRDANGLADTAAAAAPTTITTTVLDVSHKDAVDAWAAQVLRDHGRVDVLVNNAGVSIAGDVSELTVDEIEWLMNINFWGVVYGVKAFLPALQRAGGRATLVNVSSVFGLYAPPGQSAYAASKFAVRGFTESLREELRGSGVHVITVHPGGIKTNIARSSRIAAAADATLARSRSELFEAAFLTHAPERAAAAIVRGILEGRDRVLIGSDAVRIDVLARLLGPGAPKLLAASARRALPPELRRRATSPAAPPARP